MGGGGCKGRQREGGIALPCCCLCSEREEDVTPCMSAIERREVSQAVCALCLPDPVLHTPGRQA